MQIAVILHDVASQLFLFRSASVRIESLLLLDVVACEDDYIPSARVLGAPLLEAEAVHGKGYLLGREGALHGGAHELDDARGGEELAHLVAIGHAQVGGDELLFHAGFLELAVVASKFGIVPLTPSPCGDSPLAPLRPSGSLAGPPSHRALCSPRSARLGIQPTLQGPRYAPLKRGQLENAGQCRVHRVQYYLKGTVALP